MKRRQLLASTAAFLAGCGALPDKPTQQDLFDFGPLGADTPAGARNAPALVLAEVDAGASLETTALLYRLGYAEPNQLRRYAVARWSAQPARLVRTRLREVLGRERAVLDASEAAALARTGSRAARVLRVELEEFSHFFESPAQSHGLVRMRCTLLENTAEGERLVAQRVFSSRRSAPTNDAPGGVRALVEATDAVAQELAQWLRQTP